MSTEIGSSLSFGESDRERTFRATQLWQELVLSFRLSMPRCRHRLKMRWYEDSFNGREAVEWLHNHLQTTGAFGTVSRDQAVKLLQKFLSSDVIMEVRGKLAQFDEDTTYLYKFVTEPGPFNFIEDSSHPLSSVGKRGRSNSLYMDTEPSQPGYGGACFTNEYAFMRCDEGEENRSVIKGVSPIKKSRSEGCISKHLAVKDVNVQGGDKLTPSQVAATWKEVTLSRLLRLVELPALDRVLDHDAVDGKLIQNNASLSGRGLLNKAAAKFLRSVKDRKPPLPSHTPTPSHLHSLTTTHHHKRRYSTKIKSDSQSSPTHSESVTDVPQWVVLAMKCLSKWPDGCTEELVGDMPVYCGFELDILQSLVGYFQDLAEPLISVKLFDLHMAVHSLLANDKAGVTDALQLCTLLLPQTNRTRLHRMLRFIYKASTNSQLQLSKGERNKDVLLRLFAGVVLRATSKFGRVETTQRRNVEKLVTFMAHNYQQIFKVPEDLKKEVERRLDAISSGKNDFVPRVGGGYCSQLSSAQYQSEGAKSSHDALLGLLDTIIADQRMSSKDKKQRLRDFQTAYPGIYSERLPLTPPSPLCSKSGRKLQRHTSLSFSGRPHPLEYVHTSSPLVREKSDSSETLGAVILR